VRSSSHHHQVVDREAHERAVHCEGCVRRLRRSASTNVVITATAPRMATTAIADRAQLMGVVMAGESPPGGMTTSCVAAPTGIVSRINRL
jgi:hypothetical protein